jgi:hypothetical protein
VFDTIRQARPTRLFIAADGPRHEAETALTDATRLITEQIDWPCEVHRHYATENMGCKMRPFTAINWAFEQADELIILEDDCLPHPDFFGFCQTMLERYRNNEQVFNIGGTCLKTTGHDASYYFTRHTYIWGWATWKRAWKHYDIRMDAWNKLDKENFLNGIVQNKKAIDYWKAVFNTVVETNYNVWDYQWLFTSWLHNGFSIVSNVNLISNIGFGASATHTHNPTGKGANMPTETMGTIRHPLHIKVDTAADQWVLENVFIGPQPSQMSIWANRILLKLKSYFK